MLAQFSCCYTRERREVVVAEPHCKDSEANTVAVESHGTSNNALNEDPFSYTKQENSDYTLVKKTISSMSVDVDDREVFSADDPRLVETVELATQLLPGGEATPWQRAWCTTENVSRFLRGRRGDPEEAAKILAQALQWRSSFEAVLSGQRVPRWQGDLRVIARGDRGHTIVYGCFRHMPPNKSTADAIDHMAVVLEAWHSGLRQGATQGDFVLDCLGFRLLDNLQPAILLSMVRAMQQPFRDCLRTAIIVDAPRSFEVIWRTASPLLRPATKRKVQFLSCEGAVALAHAAHGAQVANKLERVMRLNRTAEGCTPARFPSEVEGHDGLS
uniref:CRAL-TRIO domain-containing protein n=1 Tax=Alexandrium catenella TaxID=2925 RepID=A0A7S1Q1Q4_ALECA